MNKDLKLCWRNWWQMILQTSLSMRLCLLLRQRS